MSSRGYSQKSSKDNDPARVRILMFGPHLNANSGISNVVNNWLEVGIGEKVELRYVTTLRKYVPGRYLAKSFDAAISYVLLIIKSLGLVDIVHIHMSSHMSFFRKWFIFYWAKHIKIKTIVHLHGGKFEEFYNDSSQIVKRMITDVLNSADAVFVLSNSWKNFVKGISKNQNIYIVYNGACLKKFAGKIHNNGRIVISFMGRLGKKKGVYDLLAAFQRIIPDFPDAHLVLGGDGEVKEVKELLAKKNLEGRVNVLGWVSGQQKIRVFRDCDIYVLPSYNEGLPGSVLEAMAAGVPIISTPVGGIPEAVVVNRNGYLIKPGDVDALYKKLLVLCQDNGLRERMGKESRKIIEEKFDIKKITLDMINIYHEVLNKNETNSPKL